MNAPVKSFKPLTGYERVVLEHILKTDDEVKAQDKQATVVMRPQFVTKIETFTNKRTADSGNDEITVKMFTEKDACLVSITSWDTIADKETYLRTQIVPSLSKFNLDPSTTILLQFLDSRGRPMRYEPSIRPKALLPQDSK